MIAIYSRKSKFTGKGESIENQIEWCKEYIRSHYTDNEITIYEDEGFSGGNTERPQFRRLMEDAKAHKFNTLVCYRLDRVSRNIGDFSLLIGELNSLEIGFVSVKELFDTATPMGRAMMFIASVFSQLERETIAERIKDNMLELAKTGRWLGGTTPTGYQSEAVTKITMEGKTKKAFKLIPVYSEQEIVKTIFYKYLELKSQTAVETYLIQNNIKTKNGNNFTRFTIRGILDNPVYAIADQNMLHYYKDLGLDIFADEKDFKGERGIMAYNKTLQTRSKANQIRDMREWIISVGQHKGIISGKDWIEVQELLERNKDRRYRKPPVNSSILTGLISCGACGSLMRPKIYRSRNEEALIRFSYLCELKEKSRGVNCNEKNISGIELDQEVLGVIQSVLSSIKEIGTELVKLAATFEDRELKTKSQIVALKNSYNKNKMEISNLIDRLKYVDKDMIKDVTTEIRRLKKSNLTLAEEIQLQTKHITNALTDQEIEKLFSSLLHNYFMVFYRLELTKKRSMIKSVIRDVVVKEDTIHINFLGTGETCTIIL